jgi:hypothetical protein
LRLHLLAAWRLGANRSQPRPGFYRFGVFRAKPNGALPREIPGKLSVLTGMAENKIAYTFYLAAIHCG